jgi:cytidylate kinase
VAALGRELPVTFRLEPDGGGLDATNHVLLDGEDVSAAIRTPEMARGASVVSALPPVREALLDLQRRFARRGPVAAEGRDTGTVVFPRARLKVFLEASAEERARRRHRELQAMGHPVPLDEVLADQNARDAADRGRAVAPLQPAADAVVLDTTELPLEEVVRRVVALARKRGF